VLPDEDGDGVVKNTKKIKPPTTGEKIAWHCIDADAIHDLRCGDDDRVREARNMARRIDAAIRRERNRCKKCVMYLSKDDAIEHIEEGWKP
jgi:hypothetical protein